jgi:hypothetical protein
LVLILAFLQKATVTQMNTGFPTLEVCEYCNQAFAEGVVEEH